MPPDPVPSAAPSPVGVHVPVGRGLAAGGLRHAAAVGAEAVQVFVANPRGWALPAGKPDQDEAFLDGCRRDAIPAYVHSPYLVNLASPTPATLQRSIASVRHSLDRGRVLGARGVVVHTGSSVTGSSVTGSDRAAALAQVRAALLPVLEELPDDGPDLLLEPTAGQGQSLCATVDDLGPYLEALEAHPRVGVCLDTCHAFAAGHELSVAGGVRRMLDRLVEVTGPGRLRLVHANDSKDPVGSGRDRHERVGRGHIGEAAFAELFAHPATRGVPVVLETPGEEPEHIEDIAMLRKLRDG
ncbi:MAG: deoxyribonuclease IV [Actinomycetota bacterium]|nr:deoxyribonuclease IV [Actinomycetota bacterium]